MPARRARARRRRGARARPGSSSPHPAVDRVILTGAYETAALFRSWRPDLPLARRDQRQERDHRHPVAPTSTSPSRTSYASAFGHAGQKCSAASLVILVGSVGASRSGSAASSWMPCVPPRRLPPQDPSSQMGPLIEPANGKLLARAHDQLQLGEELAREAAAARRRPGGSGRRASATGVAARHRTSTCTEFFGPVLGVMHARATSTRRSDLQNAVAYGLTAGLHSLDPDEVAHWLDGVRGGQPLRQPRHHRRHRAAPAVRRLEALQRRAAGAKAGGPNYPARVARQLACSGEHAPREATSRLEGLSDGGRRAVVEPLGSPGYASSTEFDRRAACCAKPTAWRGMTSSAPRAMSRRSVVERNVFRYRPAPCDDPALRGRRARRPGAAGGRGTPAPARR